VRRGITIISKTNTATKRHENIDQRDIAMPFHCPSLSSQYHRPHHRYVVPNQEEEELMLRGKHGNEEEIKHRASADTSDSRTMGDVNGKFDLGGSAPASFVSIFVCRVIPPYRFIPYAMPMFDVFHRVI
jgi:hypothetical protein